MSAEKVDHKAEALKLLDGAHGYSTRAEALAMAHVYSNLAIAEGQERVAEELKRLVEGVAFGLRDELQQALSEIVVAVKGAQS